MNRHSKTALGLAILFLILLTLISSCHKKKPLEIAPEIASSDEALYKVGEQVIKKDTEKGLLYLRQLIDSFPRSFYAQRAKLLIADTYFNKGDESNMLLASAEYREFIRSYPYSPSAAYCQYQIAMSYYKKAFKPGRDQSKTIQALEEFKKVIANYPASDQARAAEEKIKDCEQRLAEHTFIIGNTYFTQKAYLAAIDRLKEIMTSYPAFTKMDLVYYLLGECYFIIKKYDEAVPYFRKVVSDYAQSRKARTAQDRLKEIARLQSLQKD